MITIKRSGVQDTAYRAGCDFADVMLKTQGYQLNLEECPKNEWDWLHEAVKREAERRAVEGQ